MTGLLGVARAAGHAALFGLCLAASPAIPAPQTALFERIVAVVDKDVITEGELLAEAKLALVLREGGRAATVAIDAGLRATFLQHLIDQILIARDSRRMGAAQVADEEIDGRLRQVAGTFESQDAYLSFIDTLTMDPAFVRSVVARDLTNERYIVQRLGTRLATQSPATAGQDADSAMARALRGWLKELRQGVAVRVLDEQGLLHTDRSRP